MYGSYDYDLSGDFFPADAVASRHLDDPLISAEVADLVDEAELMGIDLDDPEIMGAWLKNLIGKIKKRVQKRKLKGVTLTTDQGTASLGPGGLTYQSNAAQSVPMATGATGSMGEMVKNPMVIMAGVGLLVLIAMRKKRR